MIAGRVEGIGQAGEDARIVVVDGRGLAVHDTRRADHVAAEGGADRLVAEADAEDRDRAREALDQRHRDAGLARRARSRRDDDAVGRQRRDLRETDAVVAPPLDLRPELREILHEVVGEGVVVVDHEEPRRHHSPSASRTAFTTARALFTHSRCSASGSESATMPAPAWMNARPSRISTERMAIAVSMPPP